MAIFATPRQLRLNLYLRLAEQMPEDAPDEWFLQPDKTLEELNQVSDETFRRFIRNTDILLDEISQLVPNEEEPVDQQYMALFYDAAKRTFDGDKKMIRTYFMWLYGVVFHSPNGPRWGEFVRYYGAFDFAQLVRERFNELM